MRSNICSHTNLETKKLGVKQFWIYIPQFQRTRDFLIDASIQSRFFVINVSRSFKSLTLSSYPFSKFFELVQVLFLEPTNIIYFLQEPIYLIINFKHEILRFLSLLKIIQTFFLIRCPATRSSM